MLEKLGFPASLGIKSAFKLTHCNSDILQISICRGREYKDGTAQYHIYLEVPSADSSEIITLKKVRGTEEDAIGEANRILGFGG